MSLSDLASLGSFISGIAVLISLVYLSLQVRQAERNQRALMQQGRANRVSDNCLRIAEPALAQVWSKATASAESLSAEELGQFLNICRSGFVSGEDSFLHHRSGQLDDAAFRSFGAGIRAMFRAPGLRAAWRLSAAQYGDEFAQFMNGVLKETPVDAESDRMAEWIEMVRSEKSGSPIRPSI